MARIEWFDQMLTATTDLFFNLEMELLLHQYGGSETLRLLDVGCGNGEYLSRLSRHYPGWQCTGLELDEGIYQYAVLKETPNLSFVHSSYENYESDHRYDLVLVRLVAAHLQDQGHFMRWLRDRTHPHSTIIIIDIEDAEETRWSESLPLFSSLYSQMRRPLRRTRLLRLKDSLALEARFHGFASQQLFRYRAAADALDTKRLMYRYMQLVTGYHYGHPLPADREDELVQWFMSPDQTFEVHMFAILLKTVDI
ncbi:class I SAM-dependent methyltransferase [Paenibacillus sepulcri]|uniref:Class I SAM-dependent methyltransferase n=1 Tax=Paenibacillus sepulcri TaxID=359917 RepID=A0ABS7BYD6_9BACL|nr:class I SAM-dependent methyltransferase [Paenibacillus sepulcri]